MLPFVLELTLRFKGRDIWGKAPWTSKHLEHARKVIDEMQRYDNTAGFFLGNQLASILAYEHSYVAPFLKSAIRDVKSYIKKKKYRSIPIGFEDNSRQPLHPPLVREYLTCPTSTDTDLDADFFAQTIHQDCYGGEADASDKVKTMIEILASKSQNSTIPVIVTDLGGNSCANRTFAEMDALYSNDLSGAFLQYDPIYPFRFDHRLVNYQNHYLMDPAGEDLHNEVLTPTPVKPSFDNLKEKWATLKPVGVRKDKYAPTARRPACPLYQSELWGMNGAVALPKVDQVFDNELKKSWETQKADAKSGARSRRPVGSTAFVYGLLAVSVMIA
ncbi:hypothetical protein Vi05172_g13694 [Venturia inaequalis]|nr:hypothetical protein Vi05172_g13694 [Venturia inaequalis]